MAYETLIVNDRGPVRVITVNRPDAMNALNKKVLMELSHALDDVESNELVRAAVLTGCGDKAFVAGADVVAMKNLSPAEAEYFSNLGHRVMDKFEETRVPIIAAVNGFALGGGLELALACDFIYASDNARLGLVEVNLGLIPGFGGIARMLRRIGVAKTREFIYTAHIMKAPQALEVGLVNRIFPQADLVDEAVKVATAIAEKGPYAVEYAKLVIRDGQDADLRTANRLEQHAFGLMFGTEDAREGITAFLEKRPPQFRRK